MKENGARTISLVTEFGFVLFWGFRLNVFVLVNRFNHTSWVTTVTPTDRPKSVRNSCVIKVFGGVFMLSRCFLDCSVGVGVFVTGQSQISSFFSCFGSEYLPNPNFKGN